MKISSYTTIMVISCMFMGILTSGIIYFQNKEIDIKQSSRNELTLKKTEVMIISTLMTQWLTTLDLFLINKQTYLYKGLRKQAENLTHLVEGIADPQMNKINHKVGRVITLCDELKLASHAPQDKIWQFALTDTDKLTENIALPINQTLEKISNQLAITHSDISQRKKFQTTSIYILMAALLAFTFMMLHWSNKNIVSPIQKLTTLTQKKNIQADDFQVKGPDEINTLSTISSASNHC